MACPGSTRVVTRLTLGRTTTTSGYMTKCFLQCDLNMNMILLDAPLLGDNVFHDVGMLKRVFGNTTALETAIEDIA